MTFTLYLMTQKGYEVLKALIGQHFTNFINSVVIGTDEKLEEDFSERTMNLCKIAGLNHFNRNETFTITSDYSIAISWRWLIPPSHSKLIVLHDSLLPRYRGFAPLVSMLINREPIIGVTAIFATEDFDKGDIISQSSSEINYPLRIEQAIEIISKNYIELVLGIFSLASANKPFNAVAQNDTLASYSLWRNEEDYLIDWIEPAERILDFINAVSHPYKGASSYIKGRKVRILTAELAADVKVENRSTGKVLFNRDQCPVVVCSSGLLKLTKIIDDKSGRDMLPLKNFRTRFTTYPVK